MLRFLGLFLLVVGATMLAPIPAAFILTESQLAIHFAAPASAALGMGALLRWRFKPAEASLGDLMAVAAAGWILAALFGSVPYMLSTPMGFIDSLFESMSGFTTTGLTTITDVEGLPSTILLWRSLTQWIGGIGIITLFLTALVGAGTAARKLYVAEARTERIEPSIRETARSLWKIYILFTALGILGFYFIGGMGPFESINHGLTAISTGGFTTRNASFSGYGAGAWVVAMMIMIIGGTSFAIHRRVLAGHWRELFNNPEVRLMLALLAFGGIALAWSAGSWSAVFHSVSAITASGFYIGDFRTWGELQRGILLMFMIIGAGYGSTGGALKLIRTIVMIKAVAWIVKRSFLPERAVVPMKIAGRTYTEHEIMEVAVYAFIYILVLVAGAAILMFLGHPGADAIFESASAQGNVGLSVGVSAGTNAAGKVTLIVQMLVGRLEIIPVVALLSYLISRISHPRPKPF